MKKGKGDGRGDPFVKMPWDMIDSPAFRNLSPTAVWLFIMFRRQWRRDGKKGRETYTLPFNHVNFRIGQTAFSAAVEALIAGGFLERIERGGLFGKAAKFGPSERWRHVSGELEADPAKGKNVRAPNARRRPDGTFPTVWVPNKKPRVNNLEAVNAQRRAQLRLVSLPGRKRRDPQKPKKDSKSRKTRKE